MPKDMQEKAPQAREMAGVDSSFSGLFFQLYVEKSPYRMLTEPGLC